MEPMINPSTMSEPTIACRTLRELDVLVAEKLMGWNRWLLPPDEENPDFPWGSILQPPEFTPDPVSSLLVESDDPDAPFLDGWISGDLKGCWPLPAYTSWAGVDAVIKNRADAGFSWSLGSTGKLYLATLTPLKDSSDYIERIHSIKEVAFCLVALASVECHVRLELGCAA